VDAPSSTGSARSSGGAAQELSPEVVDRVAAALCDQILLLYEMRPLDPQAHFDGDVLFFSYRGGLSGADEAMLETGRGEELRIFREAFFESVAPQLRDVVSALTGTPVAFFSTAFDAASRRTHCYFTLERDPGSAQEQRRATLAWSEQVRRNARELRERHVEAREAHHRLRGMLLEAVRRSDRT
jgi:uncharacterized protein YbcI